MLRREFLRFVAMLLPGAAVLQKFRPAPKMVDKVFIEKIRRAKALLERAEPEFGSIETMFAREFQASMEQAYKQNTRLKRMF